MPDRNKDFFDPPPEPDDVDEKYPVLVRAVIWIVAAALAMALFGGAFFVIARSTT